MPKAPQPRVLVLLFSTSSLLHSQGVSSLGAALALSVSLTALLGPAPWQGVLSLLPAELLVMSGDLCTRPGTAGTQSQPGLSRPWISSQHGPGLAAVHPLCSVPSWYDRVTCLSSSVG